MKNVTDAKKLLWNFVNEKLNGDLTRIRDFDFSSLHKDSVYGCRGREFDIANTRIMYAVYVILWGDLLPELTLKNCGRKYCGAAICMENDSRKVKKPLRNSLGNHLVLPVHTVAEWRNMASQCPFEDFASRLGRTLSGEIKSDKTMKPLLKSDAFCFDRFQGDRGVGALSRICMFEYSGARSPFESSLQGKFLWNKSDLELVIFNRTWQMWDLLRSRLHEKPPVQEDPEAEDPKHEPTMQKKSIKEAGDLSGPMDMHRQWTNENVLREERGCISANNPYEANMEYMRDAWRTNLYSEAWLIGKGFLPFRKSSFKSEFAGHDYLHFIDIGYITAEELDKYLTIDDTLLRNERQAILRRFPQLAKKLVSRNPVYIYAINNAVTSSPDIYTTAPWLQPLPADTPDKRTLDMLESVFAMDGEELFRVEDHIRHNEKTLLFMCGKEEADEILRNLQQLPEHLRIEIGKSCRNPNPDRLPPLYEGQWRICEGCSHFTRTGRLGRCDKRWCCKWGASKPREWDLDRAPVGYHSQCPRIARHFRFETAFLLYTERFEDEANDRAGRNRVSAERKRLLRRDLAAAAEYGDFPRIRQRSAELGKTFAEFASEQDVLTSMLNYWEVKPRLIDNVRILNEEGIPIPPKWRKKLLELSGEESLCAELRRLLAGIDKKELRQEDFTAKAQKSNSKQHCR